MLRKISSMLVIALLLAAVPAGAALALPQGEEQVVKQEVIMGYFDVWKGNEWQDTNNDGSPDKPGQTGKVTKPFSYSAADKLGEYQLTRVEVKYPFSPEEYVAAGGRQYGPDGQPWIDPYTGQPVMSWQSIEFWYLTHLSQNLSVQIAGQDLATGTASVQWILDLAPLTKALNIKDEENRKYIGYQPKNFGSFTEGWRWYLPGIITWYGIPKAKVNLIASSLDPGVNDDEAEPNQAYTGTVTLKYFGNVPVENVPIAVFNGKYRAILKKNGTVVTSDNFVPGDIKKYTFTWHAPSSGEVILKGVIDTPPLENKYAETTEKDNIIEEIVYVKQPPPRMGPGSLTFKAVSQDRNITRPGGTAKWTDWVTATLKPPKPTPPRGTLDWWKITSARLTYPKKNPDFTFGTPYGPRGTKTINMSTGGHVSTVEFQEDWAMDGAKIYSMIEGRLMAESPKYYTITSDYTVKYQYHYYVWRGSGEDRHRVRITKTAATSGTASGKLLVNGTGVDSRAQ